MYEQKILDGLQGAALHLQIPAAIDRRQLLPRNPVHRWKDRKVEDIKGLVWHQELGWGSIEQVADYHTGRTSHLNRG